MVIAHVRGFLFSVTRNDKSEGRVFDPVSRGISNKKRSLPESGPRRFSVCLLSLDGSSFEDGYPREEEFILDLAKDISNSGAPCSSEQCQTETPRHVDSCGLLWKQSRTPSIVASDTEDQPVILPLQMHYFRSNVF